MTEYISHNIEETEKVAADLISNLSGSKVLALSGNLGAGKTVFVKGLAKALGIKERVNSPTFVLLKVYNTEHPQIKRLIHVDCYRLEGQEDLEDIGLSEFLDDPSNLVVIEWADRINNLPANTIHIEINYLSEDKRKILIT